MNNFPTSILALLLALTACSSAPAAVPADGSTATDVALSANDSSQIQDAANVVDASTPRDAAADTARTNDSAVLSGCPAPTRGRLLASTPAGTLPARENVRAILVDGDTLFLRTSGGFYSMPAAGGASTLLFATTEGGSMWMLANRDLAVRVGTQIGSIPRAGGAFTARSFTPIAGEEVGYDAAAEELYTVQMRSSGPRSQTIHVQDIVTGESRVLMDTMRFYTNPKLLSDGVYGLASPTLGGATRPAVTRVLLNGTAVVYNDFEAGSMVPDNYELLGAIEGVVFFGEFDDNTRPFTVFRSNTIGAGSRKVFDFVGIRSPHVVAMNATHLAGVRARFTDLNDIAHEIFLFDQNTTTTSPAVISSMPMPEECWTFEAIAIGATEVYAARRLLAPLGSNLYAIPFTPGT